MKSVLLFLLVNGCNVLQNDDYNIEPIIVKDYICQSSYKNLYNLCESDPIKNSFCCETIEPTKLGVSFTNFCKEMLYEGVDLNVECLSNVTNYEQINVCTDSE